MVPNTNTTSLSLPQVAPLESDAHSLDTCFRSVWSGCGLACGLAVCHYVPVIQTETPHFVTCGQAAEGRVDTIHRVSRRCDVVTRAQVFPSEPLAYFTTHGEEVTAAGANSTNVWDRIK